MRAAFVVSQFVPYFSYTGPYYVGGSVHPFFSTGTVQLFAFNLTGADVACAAGAGDAANSCGIHIHAGTSCAEDALGHLYADMDDPWTEVSYASDANGEADGSVRINTGIEADDLASRTLIVHAYDGTRIACATIEAQDWSASC